jgi:4-O-beta-D-mannosyl-D-glucose phosphorylase
MQNEFQQRASLLREQQHQLIIKKNEPVTESNGIYVRYKNPVLTADHAPLNWRYDFNFASNPFLMERFGINATLNAGAIKWNGKYILVARVEGQKKLFCDCRKQ